MLISKLKTYRLTLYRDITKRIELKGYLYIKSAITTLILSITYDATRSENTVIKPISVPLVRSLLIE